MKHLHKLFSLFFIFLTTHLIGQNLITNPSFEYYSVCPTTSSELNAYDWQVTANCGLSSPDYYNVCATDTQGVPYNVVGNQYAFDGNAYVGIYCYYTFLPQREYIQTQLSETLVPGQTYYVSFRVSLADDYGIAIGSMGAYFSANPITGVGTTAPITVVPQISSSTIISNTTNWVQVTGSFIANGGERFITIGNFSSDATTPLSINSSAFISDMSYYYIDMVEVTTTPLATDSFYTTNIAVSPNPCTENISIDYKGKSSTDNFEVYTLEGKLVKKSTVGIDSIDLNELPAGAYFVTITTLNSGKIATKILKK
jgi:hypothetical protein